MEAVASDRVAVAIVLLLVLLSPLWYDAAALLGR
jgi:hypothetical protein